MLEKKPTNSPRQMPRCPRASEAADYVSHELAPDARKAFEAHLDDCALCRELTSDFCDLDSTLKATPELSDSEAFTRRVMEAIRLYEARRRRTRRYLQLAACLTILIGGGLLMARRPPAPHTLDLAASTHPPESSDRAVSQALDWLIRSQESSGGWDATKWQGRKDYEVGLSGMALLALVRQGNEAPDPVRCASAIRRATEHMLLQQDPSGAFGTTSTEAARMYNHGIATVALLESAQTDQDARLRTALTRAIDFIKQQQLDSGGWGYVKRDGEQANTSVSVWQLQALQLAAARKLPDATVAYRRGLRWLGGVVDGAGSFGYQQQGDTPDNNDTLTAMGAFCLLDSQRTPENPPADSGRMNQALQGAAMRWDKETDFYRWFFLAQALRAAGGHEFQHSLKQLQNSLLATRNQEGAIAGSWDPTGTWSPVAGRVFTTAMATLCL